MAAGSHVVSGPVTHGIGAHTSPWCVLHLRSLEHPPQVSAWHCPYALPAALSATHPHTHDTLWKYTHTTIRYLSKWLHIFSLTTHSLCIHFRILWLPFRTSMAFFNSATKSCIFHIHFRTLNMFLNSVSKSY